MNPQLSQIAMELDQASARARRTVAETSPELLGRRPHQNSWSIAECLAHLTITTDAYLAEIPAALDRARCEKLQNSGAPFRMEGMARLLAWWLEPPYRMKSKTPAAFVPGAADPARALPEFLERQQKLQSIVTKADGLALDRVRIASPFAEKMQYNLYSALRLISTHQRRHLWQAEQVASALRSANAQ